MYFDYWFIGNLLYILGQNMILYLRKIKIKFEKEGKKTFHFVRWGKGGHMILRTVI